LHVAARARMMRDDRRVLVILDSTVLVADRFLQSNDLRLLLDAARAGELRVGVTEVTFHETVNKCEGEGR
jgi:hypothetical protein